MEGREKLERSWKTDSPSIRKHEKRGSHETQNSDEKLGTVSLKAKTKKWSLKEGRGRIKIRSYISWEEVTKKRDIEKMKTKTLRNRESGNL